MELTESELIEQARTGDQLSLERLLLTHYESLDRHIAQRMSKPIQGIFSAEDIRQKVFERAAEKIVDFEPRHESAFLAWLKTIASNLIKTAEKRRFRENLKTQPGQPASSAIPLIDQLDGDDTTPSRRAIRRENILALRLAIAQLPSEHQEVIQRRYLALQSLDEISTAMGRSNGSIRGILHRARENLRARLGRSSLYFDSVGDSGTPDPSEQ